MNWKRLTAVIAVGLALLLLSTLTALAAWPATDNFDTYTNGANLNGSSGGSGWAGNWGLDAGTDAVVTNAQSASSPNSVTFSVANSGDFRNVTSNTDGDTLYISVRLDSTAAGVHAFIQPTDGTHGTECMQLRFTGGNIVSQDSQTNPTIGTYSANTWINLAINFKYSTTQYKISLDGGQTYSTLFSCRTNFISNTRLYIYNGAAGGNSWFDSISATAPSVTSTPASVSINNATVNINNANVSI